MAESEVKFSKNDGKLKITIDIGKNHTGVVTFFLVDKNDKKLEREELTSTFTTFEMITDPSTKLDGSTLLLDATILSTSKDPGQKWSLTVTIKQGNKTIGTLEYPEPGGTDPETFKKILVMETKKVRFKAK